MIDLKEAVFVKSEKNYFFNNVPFRIKASFERGGKDNQVYLSFYLYNFLKSSLK